jgi:hypothetical protein
MRALFTLLWLALFAVPASAQFSPMVQGKATSSCTGYTGYGDLITGWSAFYGLQGYSCAYAAPGTNPALSIRSANTGAPGPFTINILANGSFDIATAVADAGTDATCTAASVTAGTGVAMSGCSSTPHVGSTIAGTVVTGSLINPAFIVSVGTFTGGAGVVTVQAAQTFSLTSVVLTYGMYVVTRYDQTGNGGNCTQSTSSMQSQLFPNIIGSLPLDAYIANNPYLCGSQTFTNPISVFSVADWTFNFSANNVSFSLVNSSSGSGYYFPYFPGLSGPAASLESLSALSSTTGSFAASVSTGTPIMHAFATVVNGASPASFLIIDGGTPTTGTSGTGNVTSAVIGIGGSSPGGGNNLFAGYQPVVGFMKSAPSAAQLNTLCHLAFTTGWTTTSC